MTTSEENKKRKREEALKEAREATKAKMMGPMRRQSFAIEDKSGS